MAKKNVDIYTTSSGSKISVEIDEKNPGTPIGPTPVSDGDFGARVEMFDGRKMIDRPQPEPDPNFGNFETEWPKTPAPSDDGGSCFITTACVKYYGLEDTCYQLSTLREFRDNFLLKSEEGNKLVDQYYLIAPNIVRLLEKEQHPKMVFSLIFEEINNACSAIEKCDYLEARRIYTNIVLKLCSHYNYNIK